MTNREREILNIIKDNPLISQEEMASMLGITRSSVAVHITNLMKKGLIKGKGYILSDEDEYVVAIGGANIDLLGFPKGKLNLRDSNPGRMKISIGGVARNIAENLVRLGVNTKLLTLVGDDLYGKKIIEHSKKIGLDMSLSKVLDISQTSTYLSIQDDKGDMAVALSCMDIYDDFKVDYIKENEGMIKKSKCIVLDTNIPEEIIKYIIENFNIPVFLDTVSTNKAMKVKNFIGKFYCIKPNKYEAEVLSGIKIESENDLKRAAEYFLNRGVKKVFITLGEDGIYYGDESRLNLFKTPKVEVKNATGAGDAFVAGLVFAYLNDFDIHSTAKFSTAASVLALLSEDTINQNMSIENINYIIKEMGL
ncbi:Pseudouridine kinase [Caloramator mitchellensis]|uniref:Pseudouridine kinase n=1 Tax=Caloramator mitchellensis TaxID=908809 RepID=A0A0R3JSG9_CALMK|nr:carbohydrate kinase [Caloramator mitchellensis]KRQ86411.1 Pseudouridine kinase [Caloramator mitchellensis]